MATTSPQSLMSGPLRAICARAIPTGSWSGPAVPLKRLFLLLTLTLAACAPKPPAEPELTVRAVSFAGLPGWSTDNVQGAYDAFKESCAAFRRQGAGAKWALGP